MSYPFDCITAFMFFETRLEPADVILVPGGSQPQLMEAAAKLYHQGLAPWILPSGGVNAKLGMTEWEFLRDIGIRRGVPETAILKEDQASNTFENARFSLDVLRQHGIAPSKAILVCKTYHARRAWLTYQTAFPKEVEFLVHPVVDNTGIDRDNWYLDEEKIDKVMDEFVKIGRYFRRHIPGWVHR